MSIYKGHSKSFKSQKEKLWMNTSAVTTHSNFLLN